MDILPQVGSIQAKDPLAVAPPGHSLTEDNSKWAWGQPPKDVNPDEVLTKAINSLKMPKVRTELMKLLMVGASVEVLVEGYILQAFQEGRFTPDVGLLIKGPLSMYIANIAEEENIPYRLFENPDALEEGKMNDETFFKMMKQNNPEMFNYVREGINEGIRRGFTPDAPEQESFITMDEGEQE